MNETQRNSCDIQNNIYMGLIFRLIERFGSQVVNFVVSLVLARLVAPEMYGIVSIANIFIALSNVFTISGVSNSLIQKKDADKDDFDTALVLNLGLTLSMYAILFCCAPLISEAYKQPLLAIVIRVLMIVLPVSSVKAVFQAYIERERKFNLLLMPTLVSCLVSGGLGIFLAIKGFGVWALVVQSLSAIVINTVLLVFNARTIFCISFSLSRARRLFTYGWKLLVADLLDTLYVQSKTLVIGLVYTAEDVAFFNKGQSFPQLLVSNIAASINSVLFSFMSSVQENIEQLKELTRKTVRICGLIVFPLMLGMGLVAENAIEVLLTDKWIAAVPYMQLTCIYYAIYPLSGAGAQGIKAIGRSDVILKTEITKRIAGLILLGIAVFQGPIYIAWAMVLTALISFMVNMYPQKKYLGYSYKEQLEDVLKNIGLLLPMGIAVFCLNEVTPYALANILIQVSVGVVVYVITALVSKNQDFIIIFNKAKNVMKRKRG